MTYQAYVYENVFLKKYYSNLYLKKKKMMEMKEVKEDILEGPLLLHFWLAFKIPLEPVSSIPSDHHTTLLPSSTWKRKFFETLFRFENVLLPMPSSHFEMSSFLIKSQDLLLQALLHHNLAFPW
jgi:hypothetical protein